MNDRYPDERFVGVEIHPDLLRDEADRLDATPATGLASWTLGEAAALLRLAADTWARAALVARPRPLFEGTEADLVYPATPTRAGDDDSRTAVALWRCVLAAGMDTDGDGLEWYLGARGLTGLAEIAAEAVEQLRSDYDECLDEVALPTRSGSATPTQCTCPRFRDTGGVRIADLACPVHGVEGTDPGDGYWGDEAVAGSATPTRDCTCHTGTGLGCPRHDPRYGEPEPGPGPVEGCRFGPALPAARGDETEDEP